MDTEPARVGEMQVGPPVGPLPSRRAPGRQPLQGAYARLEPVEVAAHGASLYGLSHTSPEDAMLWTYLAYGPFPDQDAFERWLAERAASRDPLFFAVIDRQCGQASGMASYLNIVPDMGCIEIGHIWFAPPLQKTPAATDAIFLMCRHVFDDLGYRRLEWKCNALNEASVRAARRFGFTYEGTFRQHMVVKGRNRDTAWFSLLDREWPAVRTAFERWLAPDNFDASGRQRTSLTALVNAS
jgi:RimJ/RimL family protein N-acetyltransferase